MEKEKQLQELDKDRNKVVGQNQNRVYFDPEDIPENKNDNGSERVLETQLETNKESDISMHS